MKIQPLRHYRTPRYPTLQAVGREPDLLERLPRRWGASTHLAALLGAGLAARALTAAPPADAAAPATALAPQPDQPVPDPARAAQSVRQTAAVVAPILAEALQYDGRGAFGCVAVSPPVVLTEDEALGVIRQELERAGLHLDADVDLDRVIEPLPLGAEPAEEAEDAEGAGGAKTVAAKEAHGDGDPETTEGEEAPTALPNHDWMRVRLAPARHEFPLADTNRAVYVEYLSTHKHTAWVGLSGSTVTSYDFPGLTTKVADAWRKRMAERRVVFGLFFDPLTRADQTPADLTGLDEKQRRLAIEQQAARMDQSRQKLDARSREKLRAQVRHFVAFLREQGVIDTPPKTAR